MPNIPTEYDPVLTPQEWQTALAAWKAGTLNPLQTRIMNTLLWCGWQLRVRDKAVKLAGAKELDFAVSNRQKRSQIRKAHDNMINQAVGYVKSDPDTDAEAVQECTG